MFKTTGIGTPDNQQQNVDTHLTSIQHTGSHHWNKLNSQEDMTGFSLKSPILLWTAFDLNMTQSDISGYIINGTYRKGQLNGVTNPTLFYDVYDHINFKMNVGDEHKMYINTINVGGSDARVTMDITNNNGISNGIIS